MVSSSFLNCVVFFKFFFLFYFSIIEKSYCRNMFEYIKMHWRNETRVSFLLFRWKYYKSKIFRKCFESDDFHATTNKNLVRPKLAHRFLCTPHTFFFKFSALSTYTNDSFEDKLNASFLITTMRTTWETQRTIWRSWGWNNTDRAQFPQTPRPRRHSNSHAQPSNSTTEPALCFSDTS